MNKKLIELMELVWEYNEQNKDTGKHISFEISLTSGKHSYSAYAITPDVTYRKNKDGEFVIEKDTVSIKSLGLIFNHKTSSINKTIDKVRRMLEVK